jgi:hypothetical protein
MGFYFQLRHIRCLSSLWNYVIVFTELWPSRQNLCSEVEYVKIQSINSKKMSYKQSAVSSGRTFENDHSQNLCSTPIWYARPSDYNQHCVVRSYCQSTGDRFSGKFWKSLQKPQWKEIALQISGSREHSIKVNTVISTKALLNLARLKSFKSKGKYILIMLQLSYPEI